MITLALDASMSVGDVAVLEDGRLVTERRVAMKDARQERLMPAVAEALEDAHRTVAELDRIVCGAGPGSFTSLRIAGGIAKGLAAGAGRSLWAVPSLALIVAGAGLPMGKYLAALDALRGELYVALYHVSATGDVLELESAVVIAADQLEALATRAEARVVSPTPFEDGVLAMPRAAGVLHLEQMIAAAGAVDLGTWEPVYGRLAEAQVKWESLHGRPLPVG